MMPDLSPLLGLIVEHAAALPLIDQGAGAVGGTNLLPGNFAGGAQSGAVVNLAQFIIGRLWMLVAVAAAYKIVRAGISLISGQEEDKLAKARRTIAGSLVAVMAFYLAPRLVAAIYAPTAGGLFTSLGAVKSGAAVLQDELHGIIRWVKVLVVPVAIGLIVYSGIRVIVTFGKEEGPAVLRRAIASVGSGIVLLLLDPFIKLTFGILDLERPEDDALQPSPLPLITRGIDITNKFLILLALITVAIIIYAGILFVISAGREEEQTKAKGLIIRAIVGLGIVGLSYAVVTAVGAIVG